MKKLTDKQAINAIQKLLSGTEWSANTTSNIADIVRATGRPIKDLQ